jgi:hypothetical protein
VLAISGALVQKLDLKKKLKHLYGPPAKEVVQVDVPALRFLMINGEGDPNTSHRYAKAVEALFTVSYTMKFIVKKGPPATDYGVMPLEGLWWADDMSSFATSGKSRWKWTLMIMQPDFVEMDLLHVAMADMKKKKKLPALNELRVEEFTEGRCAQVLHIGPFSEEGPTIQRVHSYINSKSSLTGKHHEIYLSDIRRADPKRWKTIIRQPMN